MSGPTKNTLLTGSAFFFAERMGLTALIPEGVTVIQKERSRLNTEAVFFMLFILISIRYFLYLIIDLQIIKYEIQALQSESDGTVTVFI